MMMSIQVLAIAVAVFASVTYSTDPSVCVLTQAMKDDLVKVHNEIRQKYANGEESGFPKAACMNELVWNDDVAKKAQEHADQGKFDHDKSSSRVIVVGGENVMMGQNLGMAETTPSPVDYRQAIYQMYTDEKADLTSDNVDSYTFGSKRGHVSQIVWGKTSAFGCGTTLLVNTNEVSPARDICMLTCNYAPPGNYAEDPLYVKGDSAASTCKNGKSSSYSALCSPPGYLVDTSAKGVCP